MPVGSARQRAAKPVFLDIRFVHHIQSQAVAQFIPAAHVRIMAGTHGVDIRPFHQQDVLKHPFLTDDTCCPGVVLVPVHPAKTNRAAVNQQLSSFNRYGAETHGLFHLFDGFPSGILQRQMKFVQIRRLRRPFHRRFHGHGHAPHFSRTALRIPFVHPGRLVFQIKYLFHIPLQHGDFLTGSILQGSPQAISLTCHPPVHAELRVYLQNKIPVISGLCRKGTHRIITDTDIRRMYQVNAAVNPPETPEILVFQIRAVAVPVDFQRDPVLSGLQVTGDIEFTRLHAALAVSHPLAVYPDVKGAHYPLETQESLSFRLPSRRQNERAAVLPHRIPFLVRRITGFRLSRHPGRVYLERITRRHINRRTVPVYFPIGGNLEIRPASVVKIRPVKIRDSFLRHGRPPELPNPVQAQGAVVLPYGIRRESGSRRLAVNLEDMMVFPITGCLRRCGINRQRSEH